MTVNGLPCTPDPSTRLSNWPGTLRPSVPSTESAPSSYSTRKENRTVTLYLIMMELWFRNLMARLRQASQPVRITEPDIDSHSQTNAKTHPVGVAPEGATEDWSPVHTIGTMDDFAMEQKADALLRAEWEKGRVSLEDVDMDEAWSEYWHHLFTCMEHAAVTDFNVGVNRALFKFGMTEKEMLGAAVMHEGSGEHELVPA